MFNRSKSKKGKEKGDNKATATTPTSVEPKKASGKESKPAKEKSRNKKKERASSASLATPESSSSLVRGSPVLETPGEATALDALGDHVKRASSATSAVLETSTDDLARERADSRYLFDDDPLKPENTGDVVQPKSPKEEEEVKRKPPVAQSQEKELLHQIEKELRKKETELDQTPGEKSIPERVTALFGAYGERYNRAMRTHEKARTGMKASHETEIKKQKENVEKMKVECQDLQTKLEENEHLLNKATTEIQALNEQIEAAENKHQEKQDTLCTELTNRITRLQTKTEQATSQLKVEQEKFAQEREQLQTQLQQLEEKSKIDLDKQVEDNHQLETQLAELQKMFDEQKTKLLETEKSHESKVHGQEKIVKKYEASIRKLETLLQEEKAHKETAERKLKDAIEKPKEQAEEEKETHENLEEELNKKDHELVELQEQLRQQEIEKAVEKKLVEELQGKLLEAEEQINQLEAREENDLAKYEGKLQEKEVQIQELEAKGKEGKTKMAELREKLRMTEEQLAQLRAKEKDVVGLEEKLQEKERQVRELEKKGEEGIAELQERLKATEERLKEQEMKREEAQKKLDVLQKTIKSNTSLPTKSAEELEAYTDNMMKLCEQLSILNQTSETQAREIEKLNTTIKQAEKIEAEYLDAKTKLSEAEANIKALHKPVTGSAAVGRETSGTQTSAPEHLNNPDIKKMKKEIEILREKLDSRDEEIKNLKEKSSGATPFDPLSPTESISIDGGEISDLKKQLREKEKELGNLQSQVKSMQHNLKEHDKLKKMHESMMEEAKRLESDIAKLNREKQKLSDHMKQQSGKIAQLKTELENKTKVQGSSTVTDSEEHQRLKKEADIAHSEAGIARETLATTNLQVERLTRELDESKEECKRLESAFDVANDEAQRHQKKLENEIESLKRRQQKMEMLYNSTREENMAMKKDVDAIKKESTAKLEREVEQLKEAAQLKDQLMQEIVEEQDKMKGILATAQAKCEELQQVNDDLLQNQEQAAEAQIKLKDSELEKLREEVKVKTAQVTQYKKQLEQKKGKQTTQEDDDMEMLKGKLASSQTKIEETEKELKAISTKHSEMQKHFEKKIKEMDGVVAKMRAQNQHLQDRLNEADVRQKLALKERELQLTQAQQHHTEMANELTRLHKDRKREDEFSRAFQEEFQAHKLAKARNKELQKNLDIALDYLDEMKQKQEVLKQTLLEHRVELPFVEAEPPLIATDVEQSLSDTTQAQWQQPQVAISHKPIASPGLYNQSVDAAGYMPPHSNAQSQYMEQQMAAEQRQQQIANWDQQQMEQQHPGMVTIGSTAPQRPRATLAASGARAASFDSDAVVGVPASAMMRPIGGHNLQPSAPPPQWPLYSRHSDGEIGMKGGSKSTYPASPSRVAYNTPQFQAQGQGVAVPNLQTTAGQQLQMHRDGQVPPSAVSRDCNFQPGHHGNHQQPMVQHNVQQLRVNPEQIPGMEQGQHKIGHPHGQHHQNVGQDSSTDRQLQQNAGQPQQVVPYQTDMGQPRPGQQQQIQVGQQAHIGQDPSTDRQLQQNAGQPQQVVPYQAELGQPRPGQQQQIRVGQQAHVGQYPQTNPPPTAVGYPNQPNVSKPGDIVKTLPPPCNEFSTNFPNSSNPTPAPVAAPPPISSQENFVKAIEESGATEPLQASSVPQQHMKEAITGTMAMSKKDGATKQPAGGGDTRRKESDLNEGLMSNLTGTIHSTFDEVNDKDDATNNSGIPLDPNLECVVCGMVFKIGQIQKFKRHSENCTGSRSST